ncbi:MAG: VCBS repeat-containing protein [Planctomycetaceae bacterium]|nr:VCBS repeat-containing protein [Planctomycetaceae bacterium]
MRKSVMLLASLAVAIPVATYFAVPAIPQLRTLPEPASEIGSRFPASPLGFQRREIGPPPEQRPIICNVQILDFDGDGRNDILACDGRRQCIALASRDDQGAWSERILAEDLLFPAHATVVDLDQDGDRDLVVSVLGDILPNDGVIGRLLWLEQTSQGFERHVLLENVGRVADCQAGDLDGDGDIDLAVAVFGYARGQVLWLENRGNGHFFEHELLSAPGTIHVPLADFDGDGDLDIAAIVSQDEEELWGFENLGKGEFRPRRLWFTINYDLGSAGLVADDLDGDGDTDLILPVGDNLEVTHSFPKACHGCFWFENLGGWNFTPRRIAEFGGTYAAAVGDLDGDGDRDAVLVSMFNNWDNRDNASIVWLENDGHKQFRTWQIDTRPTHRITVAVGDLDGDGRDDIVTGGLHIVGPFDRLGRLTAWFNTGGRKVP